MSDIGKPQRIIETEPIKEPLTLPEPVVVPEKERELEPV